MTPTPEAVEAALALVETHQDGAHEWENAVYNMLPMCLDGESAFKAAARILAAEVRRLREALDRVNPG